MCTVIFEALTVAVLILEMFLFVALIGEIKGIDRAINHYVDNLLQEDGDDEE